MKGNMNSNSDMSCHNEVNNIGDNNTNIHYDDSEVSSQARTTFSLNQETADHLARSIERAQRNLFVSTSTEYSYNPVLRIPRPRRNRGFKIISSRPVVSPERSPNSITTVNRSVSPTMEQLQKFVDCEEMKEFSKRSSGDLNRMSQSCTSAIRDLPADEFMGPIMLQADTKSSPLQSTPLLNQSISCFLVGGECRLCLQQMQALILPHVTMTDVGIACRKLRIINAQANKEQIQALKIAGSLPPNVIICELITKSNAERLIAHFLMKGSQPLSNEMREQLSFIRVAHDCFGGCSGRLYSTLAPNACIECSTCLYLYQPENFCRHNHPPISSSSLAIITEPTDRLCHWGFDSNNWAYYLRVDEELEQRENLQELEDQLSNFIQIYRNALSIWPMYAQANL